MLSKRVIAVTADRGMGKRLSAGLMAAGGRAEVVSSPADLPRRATPAELAIVHVTDRTSQAWLREVEPHLSKRAWSIAVIPKSSLEDMVAVMRSGRVAAVLVAEELVSSDVSAVASRLLFGDVFGLEKLVPWGVRVYSELVGDYQEKSVAIAAVSEFAAAMGVRRKYREAIEQCLDELLMNALYDAPVDADGVHLFANIPTKSRISLRMEQKALVQYACDGHRFAVSVRDAFGTLNVETVLRYLDKCLHASQQIDRKAGGAGLGLYLISNASTQFFISIHAGVATEAVCTFDLTAPRMRLRQLGLFQEKIDAVARLAGGPSQRVAPVARSASLPRALTAALGTAIALLVALIAIVAYPRFFGASGAIKISTAPPGAIVKVDGRVVGNTAAAPVVVDDLKAGQAYVVSAERDGYRPAQSIVSPRKDRIIPLALALTPRAATVALKSDPAGATVVVNGVTRGQTPLTLSDLPPGKDVSVKFRKLGYADLEQAVHVPAPGRRSSVAVSLRMASGFASMSISSDPPGAQIYEDGRLLPGKVTPVSELLVHANRPHRFALKRSGYMPVRRRVEVEAGRRRAPLDVVLARGGSLTVSVNVPGARVSVAGVARCHNVPAPLTSCALKNGRYRVRLSATKPYLSDVVHVSIHDSDVRRDVHVGFVETASADLKLKIHGAPADTHRAAYEPGRRSVVLVNAKGKTETKRVHVVPGKTVKVRWH